MGGLARGFLDEYSDLDIVVLLSKRDARLRREVVSMGREEARAAGVDVDLEVHSLTDFKRLRRDDNRRWECSKAAVVYDRRGRTREAVSSIVSVPEGFWVDRVVGDWAYFQWCVANPDAPKSIAEICVDRGDLLGAHYCVNYSVDLLLELVYALNRGFLPPQKWRIAYLDELAWKPNGLDDALRESMMVLDLGPRDLKRRVGAMKRLHRPLGQKVRRFTGLDGDDFWQHFLKVFVFEERALRRRSPASSGT